VKAKDLVEQMGVSLLGQYVLINRTVGYPGGTTIVVSVDSTKPNVVMYVRTTEINWVEREVVADAEVELLGRASSPKEVVTKYHAQLQLVHQSLSWANAMITEALETHGAALPSTLYAECQELSTRLLGAMYELREEQEL